jgi:hypothetical protein
MVYYKKKLDRISIIKRIIKESEGDAEWHRVKTEGCLNTWYLHLP